MHTVDVPGVDERLERGVDVDLAGRAAGGAEGHERGRLQLELGDGAPEELLVLRVGLRVAALDPGDAEPVELLGHLELVLDGEADPLELRAVAQRRVEDLYVARERRSCAQLHPVLVLVDLAAHDLAVRLADLLGHRAGARDLRGRRPS